MSTASTAIDTVDGVSDLQEDMGTMSCVKEFEKSTLRFVSHTHPLSAQYRLSPFGCEFVNMKKVVHLSMQHTCSNMQALHIEQYWLRMSGKRACPSDVLPAADLYGGVFLATSVVVLQSQPTSLLRRGLKVGPIINLRRSKANLLMTANSDANYMQENLLHHRI